MIGFVSLSSGCAKPFVLNPGAGLPDQVYEPAPVYTAKVVSVGTLTEAYIYNTESLLLANLRLLTLCIAYNVCDELVD